MSFSFYVWYRVECDDADTERAIRGMMARLGCRTGIRGRLMRNATAPDLWMEVYDGVWDRQVFELRLRQVVDEFDVGMLVDGGRNTECFAAMDRVVLACAAPGGGGEGAHGQGR